MYRFAIFLVGVVVLVQAADVDVRHCFETAAFNSGCCLFNVTEEKSAILKECKNSDRKSCDFDTCYTQKSGFQVSNGTIDKTSVEALIEKEFENYTDLMEIAKEKCLVGDITFYGPPHMCNVEKIGNCLRVHVTLNCQQWKDSEHCKEVKGILEECASVFP